MSTPSEEEARAALTEIINDGMADRGNRVNEWPEDEAAAYRIDGWAAGAARARSLQVSKTVDRVMSWLASRVSTPPSETVEWIDRTLALPCYQDVPADSYAEGITDTLKTIRKLLTAVPAVPVPPTEPAEVSCAVNHGPAGCPGYPHPTEPEEKR